MAKESLHKWFSRNKGKGWIDCKTGKPCGRKSAKGGSKRPYHCLLYTSPSPRDQA